MRSPNIAHYNIYYNWWLLCFKVLNFKAFRVKKPMFLEPVEPLAPLCTIRPNLYTYHNVYWSVSFFIRYICSCVVDMFINADGLSLAYISITIYKINECAGYCHYFLLYRFEPCKLNTCRNENYSIKMISFRRPINRSIIDISIWLKLHTLFHDIWLTTQPDVGLGFWSFLPPWIKAGWLL